MAFPKLDSGVRLSLLSPGVETSEIPFPVQDSSHSVQCISQDHVWHSNRNEKRIMRD